MSLAKKIYGCMIEATCGAVLLGIGAGAGILISTNGGGAHATKTDYINGAVVGASVMAGWMLMCFCGVYYCGRANNNAAQASGERQALREERERAEYGSDTSYYQIQPSTV